MNSLRKILSGRYLLVVTAALVFYRLAVSGILTSEQVYNIVLMVFVAYFGLKNRSENGSQ